MIEFEPTEGQKNFREMVHFFAAENIRPHALWADRNCRVPDAFLQAVSALGLAGGEVPRSAGGEGGGAMDVPDKKGKSQANRLRILATEELAWGDPAVILSLPGPGLGGPPVQMMGTPEQKKRFLGVFGPNDIKWGAYATTEPSCGSDVAAMSMTAVKDGDHYVLDGTKCFITNGAKAEWTVVFATVDRSLGKAGHRAFVVERGTPGFTVGKIEKKMGLRASETAELVFADCRVPAANLLGGEDYYEARGKGGFKGAMKTFDSTRPLVGIMAVGIARAAWEATRDWLRANPVPAPRHGTLADQLARMAWEIDAARLLCWRAAWMADEGLPNSKEASMAKARSAEVAQDVTSTCMEVMGPDGVLHANLVEKLYRDQKVYDIFEGTGQVQRIVISRRVFEEFA